MSRYRCRYWLWNQTLMCYWLIKKKISVMQIIISWSCFKWLSGHVWTCDALLLFNKLRLKYMFKKNHSTKKKIKISDWINESLGLKNPPNWLTMCRSHTNTASCSGLFIFLPFSYFSVRDECVSQHDCASVILYAWITTWWSACVFQSDTGIRSSFILMPRLIHLPGHAGPPTQHN